MLADARSFDGRQIDPSETERHLHQHDLPLSD